MVHGFLKDIYYKFAGLRFRIIENDKIVRQQNVTINEIREKGFAKVLFFASNLPQWEYQGLYELLIRDNRFATEIAISGFKNNTDEQNEIWLQPLKQFFDDRKIKYFEATDLNFNQWLCDYNPDIIFYPQPYDNIYPDSYSAKKFYNKLIGYTPYCYWDVNARFGFNEDFHNHAWRLYYANRCHEKLGRKLSYSGGRGIVVTGYPKADIYLDKQREVCSPWKKQDNKKIKIIWAPHYSLKSSSFLANQSTFLEVAEDMLKIVEDFRNDVQFALKPHPRLYRELCNAIGWNKNMADEYFNFWKQSENTQLELGDYIDLFLTSDALIHDSGSFTTEYFYTLKPAMFLSNDIEKHKEGLCDTAKRAIDCHYIGRNKDDIKRFIRNIIDKGEDEKYIDRKNFYDELLLPPNGRTVAQNMYTDMVKSIFE